MFFYRFLSAQYALEALQQQRWKVGRLLELNDPCDCQPALEKEDGSFHDISKNEYCKSLFDRIGITCFSVNVADPVLWSHYCENHKGIAFGFDPLLQQFVRKISYGDNRGIINEKILRETFARSEVEALEKVIKVGFTKKASSWAYEQEWRGFHFLSGCKMTGFHYFESIPQEKLRRVVLGYKSKVTAEDVCNTLKGWSQIMEPVEIFKAEIAPTTYDLTLTKVGAYPRSA